MLVLTVLLGVFGGAYASDSALFELQAGVAAEPPFQGQSARLNFKANKSALRKLRRFERHLIELPDKRRVFAKVIELDQHMPDLESKRTVLSFEEGNGALEFIYKGDQLIKARLMDAKQSLKVYEADLNASGLGEFRQQDENAFLCINYPTNNQEQLIGEEPSPPALSQTPSEAQLRLLQSKPLANKVLYLNYWGGTLSGTRWNAVYNGGASIAYTAYSFDGNTASFSTTDRYLMWLGWRETVEDYAPFDVNITTDQAVYDATPSADRSMVIATNTTAWFGGGAGGVAYPGSFGNDYDGVAWIWNDSASSFGQTMSHESGHQMGLSHDGFGGSAYYGGHGANSDWGPIMGAPFGHTYVQWSKGDYPNANNTENDLTIIGGVLGSDPDSVGDDIGSALQISSSATVEGVIEPMGLIGGADTDVYKFVLGSPQTVTIEVIPYLGAENEAYGTNLSLDVQLTNSLGAVIAQSALTGIPETNLLTSSSPLGADTYYIYISPLTPDASWNSGFDEYANGGIYSISINSSAAEPDLVSGLTLDDVDVFVGQLIGLNAEVQNIGNLSAASTTIRFYQSDDNIISAADTEIATQTVSSLSSLQFEFSHEQVVAPNSAGPIYYGTCLDVVVSEAVVSNNCSAAAQATVNGLSLDLAIGDAVEQPYLIWRRGGDASFHRQMLVSINEGDSAETGTIGNNEQSYLETTALGPGSLSFFWKASTEAGFDYFKFTDNGVEIDSISGLEDWAVVNHTLSPGEHLLRWTYDKDAFVAGNEDAAWLDQVVFTYDRAFEITAFDSVQGEGDSGTVAYTYTIVSTGASSGAASVDYSVIGSSGFPADADDFGGVLPTGTLDFAPGQLSNVITVYVTGDQSVENDEVFSLALNNPQAGTIGGLATAQSTILSDDPDADGDLVTDVLDNCPLVSNPSQINTDLSLLGGDIDGDACDLDDDADGVLDVDDNCPVDPNPGQVDICTLCFVIKAVSDKHAVICL